MIFYTDPHLNHSDSNGNIKHLPLNGYVITALSTSTVFCIILLGVFSTISIQWYQRRQKRCNKVAETSRGPIEIQAASPQQLSEPIYAECSLPVSSQELDTYNTVNSQVNMYV